MINIEEGMVEQVLWKEEKIQCLEVKVGENKEKAINYIQLSGTAFPGDRVVLNTTAVRLGLGSGGFHFVITNKSVRPVLPCSGHIIKMRYTPLQLKVKTWEENQTPNFIYPVKYPGLHIPVVIGELHSMLMPFVRTLKLISKKCRIVYVMSDSASLPLVFSSSVRHLKEQGLLSGTITAGQAFGGDIETVNIYTAFIAAREELKADVIIVTPGPGVVGTGTLYGFSGVEQGEHVERCRKLKGIPIVIPRISFADPRARHRGISHHTLTTLGDLTTKTCLLPLPGCKRNKMSFICKQLLSSGLWGKHRMVVIPGKEFSKYLEAACAGCRTMGRDLYGDPDFFAAIAAAACLTNKIMTKGVS